MFSILLFKWTCIVPSVITLRWWHVHATGAFRFDARPDITFTFIRIVRFTCLSMLLLPSNTKAYLNSYGKHLCPESFCLQNAWTPASVCMRHNCACLHFYLLVFVGWMRMQSLSGLCTGELLITCGKYKPIFLRKCLIRKII